MPVISPVIGIRVREELINIYTKGGGNIGTFNVENFEDIQHARRAIFQYFLPGFMHVWYTVLDGRDGIVFFVGEPNCGLKKSVSVDLVKRCYGVFGRPTWRSLPLTLERYPSRAATSYALARTSYSAIHVSPVEISRWRKGLGLGMIPSGPNLLYVYFNYYHIYSDVSWPGAF
ncbi:hypothetical protein B0J17DRAFT_632315 [Rhizoctonia solani]|nr:hypothetical protein B0J17DRAFT_632315 [Rhizoctonia solani]